MNICFTVPGEPRGKARPRVTRFKNGRSHSYTPKPTKDYEELVKIQYRQAAADKRFADDTPLRMLVLAYFSIPKSTPKKKRQAILDKLIWPIKKPDYDNIAKIVSDALNGIAYRDDSQIVDGHCIKLYTPCAPYVEVNIGEFQGYGYGIQRAEPA